jgi:predicted RNase H-like HicB family nuclease
MLQWHLVRMKIIIEKHPDGYVAYPIGIQGVIVGEGDTFDEALKDVQSAIRFHIATFGREALETESPALDAYIAEAAV